MTVEPISIDRVLELIETYGSASEAWPEHERAAAISCLTAHPERFEAALVEARMLDDALGARIDPEPSAALAEHILAAAPKRPAAPAGIWRKLAQHVFPQGARWPVGAALTSLLMGLVGGYAYASTGAGYDQVDSAYYAAFGFENTEIWIEAE
ncbi:MAG: hypothetical protein AAGH49_10000 [Pseudomonadota bacterium]